MSCTSTLSVTTLACPACGVGYSGRFLLPRLARLSPEQQHLAEHLVLAAGNLKQMAASLEVSYPTLRKRLDDLVAALAELRQADDAAAAGLLDEVERGETTPESAARLIRELHGAV